MKNKNDFPPAAASASASTLALSPATPAAALSDCFSHFFASFFLSFLLAFLFIYFFVFFILSLMTQLWWPGSACRGGRGSVTRERRRSKGGGGRQCVGGVGQQMLTSPKGKIEKKSCARYVAACRESRSVLCVSQCSRGFQLLPPPSLSLSYSCSLQLSVYLSLFPSLSLCLSGEGNCCQ